MCVCFVKVLLPTLGQKSASQATPLRAGHDTNRHSMSPSGTPATQSDAAPRATIADPSARPDPAQRCERHACHAKQRPMSPSATPATQSDAAPRKIKADPPPDPAQRCHQLARLPRQTAVNVTECHASAAQSEAARRATNADPSAPPDPV